MKSKKSFAEILESMDGERLRRLARKLPGWEGADIVVPSSLALEQCSSSAAAEYKARTALEWSGGRLRTVCDITGGLGADSAAFALVADKVVYVEKNPALAEAARHNFAALALPNVEIRCEEVGPDSELPECDLIYADPARRSESGRKLFRLGDCSPDIGLLAPKLLEHCVRLMVKLSPMADISLLRSRFDGILEEIHIVESGGEVRELLCLLGRQARFGGLRVVELGYGGRPDTFSFMPEEEAAAESSIASALPSGRILFEPSAAVMKSGAFKLVCSRYGICQLAPSTHLYVAVSGSESDGVPPPAAFFKGYEIEELFPLNSASVRELKSRRLRAGVSARNLRISSDELRSRLGCRPGEDRHVFGCFTVCLGNVLIVARPVPPFPGTTESGDSRRISA